MNILRSAIFVGLLSSASPHALAQASDANDVQTDVDADISQGEDREARLGAVLVTARRREENLQLVPVSMSVIGADSLLEAGITEAKDLTQSMPSMVYSKINSNFQPYIRGVGTRNGNAGDESNVSVYIDGIYQPNMSSLGLDLLNIKQVEVLRGPQGTLFGRNATGGLINIITPDPEHDPYGKLTLTTGNFGQRSVHFYGTMGLTDKIAVDTAFLYKAHDGYNTNVLTGEYEGGMDATAIRSKVLIDATDDLRIVLSAGYMDTEDATSYSNQAFNQNSIGNQPPLPEAIAVGAWNVSNDNKPYGVAEQKNIDLKVNYDFGAINLESTSSWQKGSGGSNTDSDGTFKPINTAITRIPTEYVSQEFRLLSDSEGKLNWTTGVYLFDGTAEFDPLLSVSNYTPTSMVPALTVFSQQDVSSWALFGEANYDVTDRLQLTAGLRQTSEERKFASQSFNSSGVMTAEVPETDASFDKLTYRLSAVYQATDRTNLFVSYSRGFKSGVFNGFSRTPDTAAPVRPETLDAFEFGFKSDPLDWLRVNASVFYYEYEDQQQSAREPTSGLVVLLNAAESKMAGGEFEIVAVPTDNLNLRLFGSYLDAEYDSFPGAQIFVPSGLGGNLSNDDYDASGNKMLRAPEYTFGASFTYTIPTEIGEFAVSGNAYHSAEYSWEFAGRLTQPAYTLVNGEVSWTADNGVKLAVWGKNLTNEVVYAQILSSGRGDLVSFNAPMTYGIRASMEF